LNLHPQSRDFTVLVVEDDALLRLAAVDVVDSAGLATLEAANADEAMSILESRSDICVVFTDVQMPGSMDGIALAAKVRERWPAIGVIVSSGVARPEIGTLGPSAIFLPKPYDPDALTPMLQKFCVAA
jgi:CheY-like chemotaxis protein